MTRKLARRLVAGAALGVLVLSLLTATAPASSAAAATFEPVPAHDQVNITFLSYLPVVSSQAPSTLNSMISGFEVLHPNIHVTLQTAYPTLPAVVQDEAAGDIPDVVQGTFDGWRYLVSGLKAINLTKTFGQQAINEEWGGDYPYAKPVEQLATSKGDVYGIPWTLSTPILFYNATLFQKAGLDPNDPPTTWSQVQSDALQIKSKTGAEGLSNGCLGLGGGSTLTDWCLQAIIDSAGGRVLNDAANKLTFDTPATVHAMEVMAGLAKSGAMVNETAAQAFQAFAQGDLAMILNTSATQATLISDAQGGGFTLLDAKMPGFGSLPPKPTNSGSGLFILSQDSLKQRASWEFIQYLTSDNSLTSITENVGYPPLRTGLANSPQYLGQWKHTNVLVDVNLAQLSELVPYQGYPGPNYSQIVDIIANAATSIIFGGNNTQSVLSQAQSSASSLLS